MSARAPGARSRPAARLVAVLLLLVGGGCGDPYELPALASSTPPLVRVLLRPERGRLEIRDQAWTLSAEDGRPWLRRGAGAVDVTLGVGPGGILLGPEATGATQVRVHPEASFSLDGQPYAGDLLLSIHEGTLRCVNEVDLETYLVGVIGNEMGPDAPPAAYRAQAVAARTYAWSRIVARQEDERAFHVHDTQASQVYTGLKPRYGIPIDDLRRYVRETRGVMLTWDNRPFPAYYASTCGGHTTDARVTSLLDPEGADLPLRGVPCGFCQSSSRFTWSKDVTEDEVVQGMARIRRPVGAPVTAIEILERGPGGWVRKARLTWGRDGKTREVPGTELRRALRLDSHLVTRIQRGPGGAWHVEGRGWGHGVGMCQMGAREMAARGMSEAEILRWYYPGAALNRVY